MARRIDVELTSVRDDGTWTWRAAGAKQPKGVVDAALLYDGAKVGDVVRADAEFEVEGITITTVLAPKEKKRSEPERIEIVGSGRPAEGGVTSSLVPKSGRPRRDRDGDFGPRRDGGGPGGGRPAGARRDGPGGPSRDRRDGPGADRGAGRPSRPGGPDGPAGDRSAGSSRLAGPGGGRSGAPRGDRTAAGRPDGPRGDRPERGARPDRPERGERRERPGRPERPAEPKSKRLSPANVHRAAALEALPPEQRPIAEQVLRGGIPAVRQAVEQQNASLREAGQTEVKAEPLVALAEGLLPRLKAADWRDRAEAAVKDVNEISLRDLRSVVTGADAVARDDETRLLASTLREALDRRVEEQRTQWVTEVTTCLDDGRLVRALRVSARTPDPTTKFPAELAARLSEAASAAMAPDAPSDRWATLLDAVAASPVRRSVKPVGLPAAPGEPLLLAARQASGRIPALAALLGIDMPPPPGPPRGAKPGGPLRRPPRPPRPIDAPSPAAAAAPPAEPAAAPPAEPAAAPPAAAAAGAAPPAAEAELPAAAAVEATIAVEPTASDGGPAAPAVDGRTPSMPTDAEAELPVQD